MVQNSHEYYFTRHLRERYVQRTNRKYKHMQQCHSEDCSTCKNHHKEIRDYVQFNRQIVDVELSKRVAESVENRSYLNNSGFMEWYFDKYGYDKRFEFLVHDDLLFVVVEDKGKKVIVTCVSSKTHIAGKSCHGVKKFSHIPTKEEKAKAEILESI